VEVGLVQERPCDGSRLLYPWALRAQNQHRANH
jgi:hypothetical protein